MMKKLIALVFIISVILSLASCAVVPAYNASKLIPILKSNGYELTEVNSEVQDGVVGYFYAYNPDTKDELYYIYCKNFHSANSMYNYINSKQKAKVAELKMEIDRLENLLYKSEGISAAEKGDYYEEYILKTEELDKAKKYDCGYGVNIVWYGTKQAIRDIRKGE